MGRVRDWYEKYSVNRVARIWHKLRPDLESVRLPADAKIDVDDYVTQLHSIGIKVRSLFFLRLICYTLLYASILSAFVGGYFEVALRKIALLSGVVGTAILIILIAAATRMTNIYISDAHTVSSQLISVLTHHKFNPVKVKERVKKKVTTKNTQKKNVKR